jgi:hypothetical protein
MDNDRGTIVLVITKSIDTLEDFNNKSECFEGYEVTEEEFKRLLINGVIHKQDESFDIIIKLNLVNKEIYDKMHSGFLSTYGDIVSEYKDRPEPIICFNLNGEDIYTEKDDARLEDVANYILNNGYNLDDKPREFYVRRSTDEDGNYE